MQTHEKIDLIKQKLSLLLKLSADFTDYCTAELQKLVELVEEKASREGGVSEHGDKILVVKDLLDKQLSCVLKGYSEDKESIEAQLEALQTVQTIAQIEKMDEITNAYLSEIDEQEPMSIFKERILKQELEERRNFKDQVEDMKAALDEGGILELEALFEQWLMDNAEENYYDFECNECEDPESCDHFDEDDEDNDDDDDEDEDEEEDEDDEDDEEDEIKNTPPGHRPNGTKRR